IGLNNMFIMVSDWQHSHVTDPVPKRMAHTYKEAAMSITITALTDVLKFSIGIKSDFLSVQSFCLYTATSILFCYIYTMTFLGAFMALNGRREASNRHWLTCMKIPMETSIEQTHMYNICCVGGSYDKLTGEEKKQPASNFFKDYYGPCLMKPGVKGVVIIIYLAYLATSVFGCFHIQQGTELYDLAADNSHVTRFNIKDRQYFYNYGPVVMVIVKGEMAYWDKAKRSQLQACIEGFKEPQFVDRDIYTSWLDSYLSYGQEKLLNLDDKDVFLSYLPQFFDLHPFFKQDVNLTGDAIHASRFFIQTVNITKASEEIEMLKGLKAIAGSCQVASLLVYNHEFIYYDQYDVVVKSTVKNVLVITGVMLVVSLLLIPNPVCSLLVACSIGSVTVGVNGFMALWDISLDSISMIIFTVCIGYTVDFSAHVSYAFVSSEKPHPNDKAVDALSSLGYPIIQAVLSTVLGVSVLSMSEFYIFRAFFKIFFLVMFIGMLHGLPTAPSASGPWTSPSLRSTKRGSVIDRTGGHRRIDAAPGAPMRHLWTLSAGEMAVFWLSLLLHVGFVIGSNGLYTDRSAVGASAAAAGEEEVEAIPGAQLAHLRAPGLVPGEKSEEHLPRVVTAFLHTGDSTTLKHANCSRKYELTSLLRGRSHETPHYSMSGVLETVLHATNFLNVILQANRSREHNLRRDIEWYHALVRSILEGDAKIHRAVVTFGGDASFAGPPVLLQATRAGGEIVLKDLSRMAHRHLHNRTADTEWYHGMKEKKEPRFHRRVMSKGGRSPVGGSPERAESFIPDRTHVKWSAPYLECENGNFVPRWLLTLSAAFYGLKSNLDPEFR
ncbi:hypothetical protein GOODEAATRI_009511, partial [Goodea atripinnis]